MSNKTARGSPEHLKYLSSGSPIFTTAGQNVEHLGLVKGDWIFLTWPRGPRHAEEFRRQRELGCRSGSWSAEASGWKHPWLRARQTSWRELVDQGKTVKQLVVALETWLTQASGTRRCQAKFNSQLQAFKSSTIVHLLILFPYRLRFTCPRTRLGFFSN